LIGIFTLFVYDRVASAIIEATGLGVDVKSIQAILSASLFAILLWLVCNAKLWRRTAAPGQEADANVPASVISPISPYPAGVGTANNKVAQLSLLSSRQEAMLIFSRAVAVILLLLVGLGYVNLAYFVFHRVVLLALLLIVASTIRALARWGLHSWVVRQHRPGPATTAGQDSHDEPGFWLGLTLDLTWFALCIPAGLLVIGFDWLDINRWFGLLSTNINIGNVSVSFVSILTALLVLLLFNAFNRRITGLIDNRLEQHAHMGSGERASVIKLVTYTGMIVALLLALGIIGVGWTQLAIIAGALSVGIGFGLQGIVNNFVSGLVLLFERPVKVGDWIVVSSGEGYVRDIGARSTMIESFDRSSIIVPNSQLITESVQNWFYKNRRGRISVTVGVAYDADPEQVRDILLACASEQVNVVNYPYAPRVRWLQFGDSSLDFQLIAFISDIDNAATVRSDLHFAIFKAFKDAGIVIPFPQRDLHIKPGNDAVPD